MIALVLGAPGPDRPLIETALRAVGLDPVAGAWPVNLSPAPSLIVLDEAAPQDLDPSVRRIPLIVISARRDIDSFSNAITAGAAAYLPRPLDAAILEDAAARLARWSRGSPSGDQRRRSRRPLLLDADLEVPGRSVRLRALLLDVSASGCRLESPEKLQKGLEVRLIPRALEASTEIALGAVVRWSRRKTEGAHVAALRFNATSALLAGRIFGARPTPK